MIINPGADSGGGGGTTVSALSKAADQVFGTQANDADLKIAVTSGQKWNFNGALFVLGDGILWFDGPATGEIAYDGDGTISANSGAIGDHISLSGTTRISFSGCAFATGNGTLTLVGSNGDSSVTISKYSHIVFVKQ